MAALEAAFTDALAGRCRGVLIAGAPGVGKTALIDQLRPVVTGADGWFVAGKFDQYRRDLEFDAGYQAFRALGRLLLAEPEDELAQLRMRIVAAAGPNAGLLAAVLPEFATLLGVPPDAGDPLTAQARVQRATAAALRAVASRKRPVVLFLDDLQWAGGTPLGFVDLVLSEEPVEGLLLVGAYRDGDVDAAHPLAAPLARWRNQATVRHLRLGNLPEPGLAAMVADMLRVDLVTVAGLAGAIEPHTHGNPYETVELLNALRRDGLLTATAAGWRWDEAAVRAHLGRSEVAGLLAARAAALPEQSRQVVEAMACLGGRAELSLLQAATGEPAAWWTRRWHPPWRRACWWPSPGRIRRCGSGTTGSARRSWAGWTRERRRALQLAMARRLAAVPELFAVAAEQYLPVADAVGDAAERRQVVGLLRRAAGQATLTGDYALVHALLTAALAAVDPGETATLAEVHAGRHAALYGLGRLEEADEVYRTIERLCPAVLDRADATAVQVRSVTHRTRFAEALGLGLESLRELGITVPAADRLAAELDHQFGYLVPVAGPHRSRRRPGPAGPHRPRAARRVRPDQRDPAGGLLRRRPGHGHLAGPGSTADLPRARPSPCPGRPRGLHRLRCCGAARRLRRRVPGGAADPGAGRSPRLRARHLPGAHDIRCPQLLGRADRKQCPCRSAGQGGTDRGGRPGQRRLRLLCVGVRHAGLRTIGPLPRRGGSGGGLCAPYRQRAAAQVLDPYRWLAGVLLGESTAAAGEAVSADKYAGNPLAQFHAHLSHATAAAIFGDPAGLERHTAAAMPLVPMLPGLYPTGVARLLRALALAGQARDADADSAAACCPNWTS